MTKKYFLGPPQVYWAVNLIAVTFTYGLLYSIDNDVDLQLWYAFITFFFIIFFGYDLLRWTRLYTDGTKIVSKTLFRKPIKRDIQDLVDITFYIRSINYTVELEFSFKDGIIFSEIRSHFLCYAFLRSSYDLLKKFPKVERALIHNIRNGSPIVLHYYPEEDNGLIKDEIIGQYQHKTLTLEGKDFKLEKIVLQQPKALGLPISVAKTFGVGPYRIVLYPNDRYYRGSSYCFEHILQQDGLLPTGE